MSDINPEQLLLQLGAIGAVLFVVYKIGMKWLDRWSEQEREKNAQLAQGFQAITSSVNAHTAADIASHERLVESHGELRETVVRMDSKLDTIADLTPVRGTVRPKTNPRGVPTGYYGPRPPTVKDDDQ